MTTVIGTRIHQLLKCQERELQFMVGNLQESRIPMDRLDNVLGHFGDLMVGGWDRCGFVFVMGKKVSMGSAFGAL